MRGRHLLLASAVALGTAALGAPLRAATAKASDPQAARLRRQIERLRHERDLSSGRGFYLRLDAGSRRLALMLEGVALDEYAVAGLEWGVPEVLFVPRRPAADWDTEAYSKGRLAPERERDRIEIFAPLPAAEASPGAQPASPPPPPVPKSAAETYSVPSPYRVFFAEGVSLEVLAKGQGGRNRSLLRRAADVLGRRFSDLGSALGLGSRERVRLRVTLDAEDAASLYRSLPPDVALLVVGLPPD
jgi:hypothetical protein